MSANPFAHTAALGANGANGTDLEDIALVEHDDDQERGPVAALEMQDPAVFDRCAPELCAW